MSNWRMAKKTKNKSGQPLGNKGMETRLSLMAAAPRLMDRMSPLNITAMAITKEAGTAPATFYVYFDDVEDILWAVCDSITEDTTDLFADDSLLRDDARLEEDALAFVKAYGDIWTRHGPVLLYRNLEADRGNARFNQLLTRIGLPILRALTDRIVAACPPDQPMKRSEANAEAVVMIAAMDRLAAAIHLYPEQSLMPDVLQCAGSSADPHAAPPLSSCVTREDDRDESTFGRSLPRYCRRSRCNACT